MSHEKLMDNKYIISDFGLLNKSEIVNANIQAMAR